MQARLSRKKCDSEKDTRRKEVRTLGNTCDHAWTGRVATGAWVYSMIIIRDLKIVFIAFCIMGRLS